MTVQRVVEELPGQRSVRSRVRGRGVLSVLGLLVVVVLTVEGVLLAPHLSGVGAALARVDWSLVLPAVGAEFGSVLALAALHRQMLRGGGLRVPVRRVTGMVLAANALSATLPAGSVLASGYSFQRMRRFGASGPLAAWTVLITGLISGAAFAVLGLGGALVVGTRTSGVLAAAVAVAATVAAALAIRAGAQRPGTVTAGGERLVRRVNRLFRRDPHAGVDRVEHLVAQLVTIRPGSLDWVAAVCYAALNWAADVACLVLACHAAGISLSPRVLLIAYAADAAAGLLQLLPAGIGTVDGALILALVSGGVPAASAAAGVLIYRLINVVLLAAIGWIVWYLIRQPAPAQPS